MTNFQIELETEIMKISKKFLRDQKFIFILSLQWCIQKYDIVQNRLKKLLKLVSAQNVDINVYD